MVTLTFDSFLRSDRSSRIYNSHFSFLLLMVMEIYIVLLRYILLPFNIRRLIFCCCSFSGNLLIVLFKNLVCSFCCSSKVEILVSIPFVGLDVVIATRTDRSSDEDSSIVTIFISLLSQCKLLVFDCWWHFSRALQPRQVSVGLCIISLVLQLFSHCNLELAGRHRL